MHIGDDLTVLIDSKEYFELFTTHRSARQGVDSSKNVSALCSDAENEVYEKCGKKCILGCQFALSSMKITAAKDECEKVDCIEGCFCKDGLVRYEDKCVPATECPTTYKSLRSNKAIDVVDTEVPKPLVKHFGLFMRPCGGGGCGGFSGCGPNGCGGSSGCGPNGCGGSMSCGPNGCGIHIHNYNEAVGGLGGVKLFS